MIKTESYLLDNNTISHIFHISDIHIPNGIERQAEYEQQIIRTGRAIKTHPKFNKKESLCVITGDIFDGVKVLSPQAVDLFHTLLEQFNNLIPTIIIPGNHDYKPELGSTLDMISAILSRSIMTNIYWLPETGLYEFGTNLVFAHTSVKDKLLIKANDIKTTRKKIALFHGMIDSTSAEGDFIFRDHDFKSRDFIGYDKILLGDVHKAHAVGNDNRIWYAGSLVQKTFGEDRRQHGGLLIWDVNSSTTDAPQYLHIPNDHEYIVLKVVKGQITGEFGETTGSLHLKTLIPFHVESLPTNSSIKFNCDKYTKSSQVDTLIEQLQQKTNIIKHMTSWIDKSNNTLDLNTITTTNTEGSLKNYIMKHYPDNTENLLDINKEYRPNSSSDIPDQYGDGNWSFTNLTMENMFNYKGQHSIKFEQLTGIIAISGRNGTGKSKIISTLQYAIWGADPKEVPDIITHGEKNAKTSISLFKNGNSYTITRTFNRNKNNKDCTILFKNDKAITSLDTGKKIIKTEIQKLFGTKEDLCDTHISEQGWNPDFKQKIPTDIMTRLKRRFNSDFDETTKTVKDDINKQKKYLKEIQQQLHNLPESDINNITTILHNLKHIKPSIISERDALIEQRIQNGITSEKHKTLTQEKQQQQQQLLQLKTSIKHTKYNNNNEIDTKITHHNQEIQTFHTKRKQYQKNIDICREAKHPLNKSLHDDIKLLETSINDLQLTQTDYLTKQTKYKQLVKHYTKHLNKSKTRQTEKQQEKCQWLSKQDTTRKWKYNQLAQYNTAINQLAQFNTQQPINQQLLKQIQIDIDAFRETIKEIDITTIERQNIEYNTINQQHITNDIEITATKKEITGLNDFLANDTLSYNPTCECCNKNKTINLIPEKLNRLESITSKLSDLQTIHHNYKIYLDKNHYIPNVYNNYITYNSNLNTKNNLDKQILNYQDGHDLKQELDDFILFEKQQKQLDIIDTDINDLVETLQMYQTNISRYLSKETIFTDKLLLTTTTLQSQEEKMRGFIKEQSYIQENIKLDREINTFKIDTNKIDKQAETLQLLLGELTQMKQINLNNIKINETINTSNLQQTLIQTKLDILIIIPTTLLEQQLKQLDDKLELNRTDIDKTEKDLQLQQTLDAKRGSLQNEQDIKQVELDLLLDYYKITKEYPLYINKQGIEMLEETINQLLWNMTKFKIQIKCIDTSIEFLKKEHSRSISIDNCSGFEKFAISLAIRITLAQKLSFNSMDSLIIDEGFGVFDTDNLKKLPDMLDPLKELFNKIFIITHIDALQSLIKHKIRITNNKNGIPTISY